MDNTRKINTTITTRYDKDHQDTFKSVLDLVNQNGISKSKAQLLLVERGLVHTNNPEPLAIEPQKETQRAHDEIIREMDKKDAQNRIKSDQANVKGQRASDDKLTNPNKAKSGPSSSKVALEEKKSSNDSNIGSWIVGLTVLGVIVYGLIKS